MHKTHTHTSKLYKVLVMECSRVYANYVYQEYIILQESIEPPYYRLNNCSESNVMCT